MTITYMVLNKALKRMLRANSVVCFQYFCKEILLKASLLI